MIKLYSVCENGISFKKVCISVDVVKGFPDTQFLGVTSNFSNIFKHKLKSILNTSGYKVPKSKRIITVSPSVSDYPKFTLDISALLCLLCKSKQLKFEHLQNFHSSLFLGSINLDGTPDDDQIPLGMIDFAKKSGFKNVYLPKSQLKKFIDYQGVNIIAYSSLKDLIYKISSFDYSSLDTVSTLFKQEESNHFDIIENNYHAKKAVVLGLGGFLNTMFIGEPGIGKSLLIKSINSVLPSVDRFSNSQLRVSDSHLPNFVLDSSLSLSDLTGTKTNPQGLIYLANYGCLSINEINEVSKNILNFLKQFLEEKSYTKFNQTVYSDFAFFATMNPCKCGYLGSKVKVCLCNDYAKSLHLSKLSYPFFDRFDVLFSFNSFDSSSSVLTDKSSQTETAKSQIQKLRDYQYKNKKLITKYTYSDLLSYTNEKSRVLFSFITSKLNPSLRRQVKLLRLSFLISILKNSEKILAEHIYEALIYQKYIYDNFNTQKSRISG